MSQRTPLGSKDEIESTRFFSIAPGIHTRGYLLSFKFGREKTEKLSEVFEVDIVKFKHPKEVRYSGYTSLNGFVYGRMNVAVPLRFGYGRQKVLSLHQNKNDVGVSLAYTGGLVAGLMKPVYLYINMAPASSPFVDARLERYNPEIHTDRTRMLGGTGFFTGFSESQIIPGVFGKAALVFDWGSYYDDYKSMELGVMVDVFQRRLPMMAYVTNQFAFPNLYMCYYFGSRW